MQVVRGVVLDYLKGGPFKGNYEFMPWDAVIAAMRPESKEPIGTDLTFDIM